MEILTTKLTEQRGARVHRDENEILGVGKVHYRSIYQYIRRGK